MLAAHYAVSPETIRRAMFMLQDVGIVAIESGSGSTVLSAERASQLVSRFRNISTITELKKNIETLSEQQKKQQDDILDNVHQLLEYIEKFRLASPILPYEVKITQDCRFLGQMISEINFWQSTGVTVVAIRKGEELIVSPVPMRFSKPETSLLWSDLKTVTARYRIIYTKNNKKEDLRM